MVLSLDVPLKANAKNKKKISEKQKRERK